MFGRKKSSISGRIDTLIARSARLQGDVEFTGGLHLEGHVIGNVRTQAGEAATLWVSEQGCVEGAVDVPNVVLNGTVKGDVHASDRVVIGATARITGNVHYGTIEMALGAQVAGKLIPMNSQGATFVRAFGALDGFRADSSLRTWLFTIARRLVLDRRRAAKRRKDDVEVDEHHAVTEGNPLEALVAQETRGRLARVMERLTPTQREVFRLRVGDGLQYREIAEIVGSTEGAARVHYHNAMRTVKEVLDVDA